MVYYTFHVDVSLPIMIGLPGLYYIMLLTNIYIPKHILILTIDTKYTFVVIIASIMKLCYTGVTKAKKEMNN